MRAEFKERMRERILDGAVHAISRLGLEKLNMMEVGRSAGVSRGTVYRYFPNREALLGELALREGARLRTHLLEALANTQDEVEQVEVVMRHAAWHVREHPVLRQLSETDPDFLLRAIRENYRQIRDAVGDLVLPLIKDALPISSGVITGNEAIDWVTRMLVSIYLIPDPNPEKVSRSFSAVTRVMREARNGDGGQGSS